ncbi:MAG TPA: tetratricopeptide repeat protein, partial [Polyangiaceae bacterium]|nr:tetratricopeptide repeat protein [Polyangiaceae bacterium]
PSDRPARLRFSDDSVVEVAKGSQVRIAETTRRGARVLLERGTASVHVAHRDQTDWTFVAGPCEVLVTGTRFDLKWDPATELFELRLREGSIEVQTPLSPARVVMRAGQELRADLAQRRMTTSDIETAPPRDAPAVQADAPVPTAVATQAAPVLGDVKPQAPPAGAPISWSKLVAEGQFKTVLAQAETRGIGRCVASCSAADLSALADAARYTGRTELAEQSLQALRSRFTGESAARGAAFLLGRLRETRGSSGDAKTWYERYLAESPGGSYASEALAGKMRTVRAVSGPAAAEPVAREYLRLYPKGVHAGTAHGILGSR